MLGALLLTATLAAVVPIPAMPTQPATDTAGVLSATTLQHLNTELTSYHDATGHRILVWIGETTGDAPLEDWTIKAAEKWKPGNKQRDDGAILFAFMRDHKVRIEVGYGLEGSLTDADASRIIQETILPRMRTGDVDGAIAGGVDRMLLTITPSFKGANQVAPSSPATAKNSIANLMAFSIIGIFLLLWFGIYVFSIARAGRRGAWYGSGGGLWWGGGGGGSSGGGGFSGGGFGGSFGGGGASGSW
jgi:uncharacterized protein